MPKLRLFAVAMAVVPVAMAIAVAMAVVAMVPVVAVLGALRGAAHILLKPWDSRDQRDSPIENGPVEIVLINPH